MVFAKHKLLTLVVILALAAGIFALASRHSVEMKNRAVEIALDLDEIASLASATGRPLGEVLSEFKKAGVTSVAVQEMSVSDLVQNGQAVLRQTENSSIAVLTVLSPDLFDQVPEYLAADLPRAKVQTRRVPEGIEISITANPAYVRTLPVGLPPRVKAVKDQQMAVVARLLNYSGITPQAIDHSIETLNDNGVHTVIFGGDQVLGFRGLVPEVAEAFQQNDINYGAIEFSKQKGDAKLSAKMAANLIRVHSIPSAELPNLDLPSAIERYVRAVKERNIRLLYVRLYDTASDDPVTGNLEYIRKIRRNIEEQGFQIKQSHPLGNPAVSTVLLVLLAAGTAAGTMLLVNSLIELKAVTNAILFIAGFLFLTAIIAVGGDMGRKVTALLTAVVFPTLAVIYASRAYQSSSRNVIPGALLRFWVATAITSIGGILIAAMLATRDFMLRLDQFAGVKLAQLLPILIIAAAVAAQVIWSSGTWQEQKNKAIDSIRKLFSEPVRVWQAAAVFAALILVAVVLARSGNEPGVGVSPLELKFRALLDHLLYVRPRTKEFMFGHPVLILAIGLVMTGRRWWAAPLFVLGTIGQVSVLNTFCHIHTPIVTSVLRVIIGAAVGSVVGVVVLWALQRAAFTVKSEASK